MGFCFRFCHSQLKNYTSLHASQVGKSAKLAVYCVPILFLPTVNTEHQHQQYICVHYNGTFRSWCIICPWRRVLPVIENGAQAHLQMSSYGVSQFHVFISESAITFCESPLFVDPPCEGIIVRASIDLLTPVLLSREKCPFNMQMCSFFTRILHLGSVNKWLLRTLVSSSNTSLLRKLEYNIFYQNQCPVHIPKRE